ncbi:endo-1,4-beta-xylanase [Bradyrhizobium sp.]|jgi:endo-1,4-beta-xylanase|uniref:endo-1,4-beta-xylanase n=1 Tax=Bradyrhizobium sp. TaxID=376 RepID=UPI003D11A427
MTITAHSRRDFLVRATHATALGMAGLSGPSAFATPRTQTSAAGANARPIPYGAAVRVDALTSDLSYRGAIIANCQIIVPEGEMKWPDIHPARGEYRFEKADALMDFARQNKIEVRGHTLAWYGGMPAWTAAIDGRAEAERELVDHIETVVSRYRGAIPSWDVVNEPLVDWPEGPTSLRPSIWTRQLGPDYLPIALRATAAVDPDAQLVLNEYDIEFKGPRFAARRQALLQLLRSLRERDVPLHAVGLQSHLFADRAIDRDGLQAFLNEIKALKLDVLITELDVIDYELPGKISERDALVAGLAGQFLETVCDVVRPKAILTWGLSDRYSWVPIYFKRPDGMPNRPLPLDADLKRKPLFDVIEEYRRKTV